jgi:hypothetical protein
LRSLTDQSGEYQNWNESNAFIKYFWGLIIFETWTCLAVWRNTKNNIFILAISGCLIVCSVMKNNYDWNILCWALLSFEVWTVGICRRRKIFADNADNLPPEMKEVYDKILGYKPASSDQPCWLCGGCRSSQDGYVCKECAEFMRRTAGFSLARCGGCGAGFFVAHGLSPISSYLKSDGIERVICACCIEHIKTFNPQVSGPPIPQGYDPEGQELNKSMAGQSLFRKLEKRTDQVRIIKVISVEEKHKGLKATEPFFKEE